MDGTWSEWTNYTDCTKLCDIGTKFRTRQCEFAPGAPKGENCTSGVSSEKVFCNIESCAGRVIYLTIKCAS